jgi:hypothetical protein
MPRPPIPAKEDNIMQQQEDFELRKEQSSLMFLTRFLTNEQKSKLSGMVNKLQSFSVFNGNKFNVRDLNLQQVSEL